MKKLADMNLVDDFLVYSLTAHRIYGEEACRYILECILQRRIGHLTVVPQRIWYGEEPTSHGVRLDVYLDEEGGEIFDMEPDKNGGADAATLPRRVRFYHAKIDAGNLAAGDDYSGLRDVAVIFISTYDPFGRKRMVYTMKSGCVEEPDLSYEDGARTIFLYTKGTQGEPAEELKQLARYLEHSTAENAQSAGLARLHEMVTEVKSDREVGLAYMKACEIEKRIRMEGKAEGKVEGKAEGKAEAILTLLAAKGAVTPRLERSIYALTDMEELNRLLLLAAGAASVEEFQASLGRK